MNKEINSLIIFEHPTPKDIKDRIRVGNEKGSGFVYAMEIGNYVKIGCTTKPGARFVQIRQGATGYGGVEVGRLAVSARVKGFSEWERKLHNKFAVLRKPGTELFSIPFEVAAKSLVRTDSEGNNITDNFEIWASSANSKIYSTPIYKNAEASQVFVCLIAMAAGKDFAYISETAIHFFTGMEMELVEAGLSFLKEANVIDIKNCGGEMLIRFK